MSSGTGRWSWWNWFPDIGAAVSRFPLAVILAGLFTLYLLSMDVHFEKLGDETDRKVLFALAASFLWVVASDLFAESHASSQLMRGLAWLAGIAAIAPLFWLQWEVWLAVSLFFATLVLVVALSAHLVPGERNGSFWLFNHRLWLAAALALLGAGLFAAGLSAIVLTLNYLFGLDLPARLQSDIRTIAFGFMAPVSWLALAPPSFTDELGEQEEREFTTRAIAALVKFVLVPLLLAYTAILYAYAVKIGLEGSLPKGTLGKMVVGYLLVGAATLVLAYPIRDSGGFLVRLFWRYWVWLALMPVALLFLAIYTRIAAYGLTENRYLIVLVGVWALILAGLRIWRGGNFDLRLVPGILAILLLIACVGPWGAIGASVLSQKAELEGILRTKGLLVSGKILPRPGSPLDGDGPLGTDAKRARQIVSYLITRRGLAQLKPWFEGVDPNPFAEGNPPQETSSEVLAAFSLGVRVRPSLRASRLSHQSEQPAVVSLDGTGYVIGPLGFVIDGPVPKAIPAQTVSVEGLGPVQLTTKDNILTAELEDGPELSFDIGAAAAARDKDRRPLRLDASSDGLTGVLLIDKLFGSYEGPDFHLTSIRFWLVLERD